MTHHYQQYQIDTVFSLIQKIINDFQLKKFNPLTKNITSSLNNYKIQ